MIRSDAIGFHRPPSAGLKPGGALLITVPLQLRRRANIVRATVRTDGSIQHLLAPEYHGDPVGTHGILCFYNYGWEFIERIAATGLPRRPCCTTGRENCAISAAINSSLLRGARAEARPRPETVQPLIRSSRTNGRPRH